MSSKKTLFMETTEIAPERTAGEIIGMLAASKGVRAVTQRYGEDGEITGISFAVVAGAMEHHYELPARVAPIYELLCQKKGCKPDTTGEQTPLKKQAKRVAWRQLLRWVQAQLAMIETGMVVPQEVFFPYLQVAAADGRRGTAFQLWIENEVKRLPAAEG